MGSKNCPETPRQKMISLMYLVLVAMLALNVDKSVLDAFDTVNQSLKRTISNFTDKNQVTYNKFEQAKLENPAKVERYFKKVIQIQQMANEIANFIDSQKQDLAVLADGDGANADSLKSKDNLDASAEYMLHFKHGTELKEKLITYKKELLKIIGEDITPGIETAIDKSINTNTPDPIEGATPSWESHYFEGYPLAAVMTLMTKLQSDVRNAEGDAINFLFTRIDAGSFKFNKLSAQVVPDSRVVLEGEPYQAKIMLVASDTTNAGNTDVVVKGGPKLSIDPSIGGAIYSSKRGAGTYDYNGFIHYKGPDGSYTDYPFEGSYLVMKPGLTVSPTKMNVFYKGVPNPVSVSVPGVPPSAVNINITNGTIEKAGSSYVVYPSKVGQKSVISVTANMNGKKVSMGTMEFRVKRVPDPVALVGGKNTGSIQKNILLAQQGVKAELPDFDFDMKFKVTSFSITTTKGGFVVEKKSNSNRFTSDQMSIMKSAPIGSRVFIDNIVAVGEDKSTRKLPGISFKIQ